MKPNIGIDCSSVNTHTENIVLELNCYLFNACSIINKLPELELLLHVNMPALVGICETHAYSEIPDELICPNGYNIFRKDRNKFGGGVALLIRNDIIVTEITTSDTYKDIEFCCVDITLNRDKFRVILYYRPPPSPRPAYAVVRRRMPR